MLRNNNYARSAIYCGLALTAALSMGFMAGCSKNADEQTPSAQETQSSGVPTENPELYEGVSSIDQLVDRDSTLTLIDETTAFRNERISLQSVPDTDRADLEKLARDLGGKLVDDLPNFDLYMIQFDHAMTHEELTAKAEEARKDTEHVIAADIYTVTMGSGSNSQSDDTAAEEEHAADIPIEVSDDIAETVEDTDTMPSETETPEEPTEG